MRILLVFILAGCASQPYVPIKPKSNPNKIKELRYYYDEKTGLDVPIFVERDLTINEILCK